MYKDLENLLRRRNQRFICKDLGWPNPGQKRHVAFIEHDVDPPLDIKSMKLLRRQVGDIPEILDFYAKYGALRLFRDTIEHQAGGYASAFYIAPPNEWPRLRKALNGWIESLDTSEQDFLPDWIDDFVVIGEVPNSSNYFLVPLIGHECGKVYEFEHDGFEFIERANDLAEFVNSISVVTDALLEEILCHTRYSDGLTSMQWLCTEYLYDDADLPK